MNRLQVAKRVLKAAALAVMLKEKAERPARNKAVVKALHLRQTAAIEKDLIDALKPLFERQIQSAATRLRDLATSKLEKGGPGSGPRSGVPRGPYKTKPKEAEKTPPNIIIHESYVKILKEKFNLTPENVASLVGAGSGHTVAIDIKQDNFTKELYIHAYASSEKHNATREIRKDSIRNLSMNVGKEFQNQGVGTRIFADQVEGASKLGFKKITTVGVGGRDDKANNGYYTWPRLGYDAKIHNDFDGAEQSAYEKFGARKISDLMKTPEGRAWWKQHGETLEDELEFDLAEGSLSRKVLDEYVKQKFGTEGGKSSGDGRRGRSDLGFDLGRSIKGGPGSGPRPGHARGPYKPRVGADVEVKVNGRDLVDVASNRIFGRTLKDNEYAGLSGAPVGSKVVVEIRTDRQGEFMIRMDSKNESLGLESTRKLRLGVDGKRVLENDGFSIEKEHRGQGVGASVFMTQVEVAASLKIDRIETTASSSRGANGAYTWARLGFDGKLSEWVKASLENDENAPSWLKSANTVHELMVRPGGREWWKENHTGNIIKDASFDLKEGSLSRKILDAYKDFKQQLEANKHLELLGFKSASDSSDSLTKQIFNPKEWDKELTRRTLPVMARHMAKVMVVEHARLGVNVAGLKSWMKNCGTGAGGFKPGNSCARGSGGFASFDDVRSYLSEYDKSDLDSQYSKDQFEALVNSYRSGDHTIFQKFREENKELVDAVEIATWRAEGVKPFNGGRHIDPFKLLGDGEGPGFGPFERAGTLDNSMDGLVWVSPTRDYAEHFESPGRLTRAYSTTVKNPMDFRKINGIGPVDLDLLRVVMKDHGISIEFGERHEGLEFHQILMDIGSGLRDLAIKRGFDSMIMNENYDGDLAQTLVIFHSKDLHLLEKHESKTYSIKSVSDSSDSLTKQIFNPKEWDKELTQRTLPVMARLGVNVAGLKKSFKASTATESLETLSEEEKRSFDEVEFDTPYGPVKFNYLTEYPQWMKDKIKYLLEETFSQDYWAKVNETTTGDIDQFIQDGLRDGWSIEQIAESMVPNLLEEGDYALSRARNIARTESGHALNGARVSAADGLIEQVGGADLPMQKLWMSVLGTTTRDTHADADGVPCAKDGTWTIGGYRCRWPGDVSLPASERCNCQCSVVVEFGMTDAEAMELIQQYEARVRSREKQIRLDKLFELVGLKNCGTGAGGFKPGNSCGRGSGGLIYDRVVEKLSSYKMLKGKVTEEEIRQVAVVAQETTNVYGEENKRKIREVEEYTQHPYLYSHGDYGGVTDNGKVLQEFLFNSKLPQDETLYRGVPEHVSMNLRAVSVGQTISTGFRFTSTSRSEIVPKIFAENGGEVFSIKAAAGSRGAFVSENGCEIALPALTYMRRLEDDHKGRMVFEITKQEEKSASRIVLLPVLSYNHEYDLLENLVKSLNGVKLAGPHKFSSTQFNIEDGAYSRTQGPVQDKLLQMQNLIDKDDLHENGLEDEHHVTLKYGLHTQDPAEVAELLKGQGPVEIRLGPTSIFEVRKEDDRFDVVKVEIDSPQLHELNKLLSENLEHTDTFPTYVPHLTLAYVKPGQGQKYVNWEAVMGLHLSFTTLVFSSKDGTKTKIDLVGGTKNCGTGSGGFKPGNTCGRSGSRSLVSTKQTADGTRTLENGDPLPPHIPKLPPAWTNVRVSLDKGADLLVQGLDGKGRVQSVYSDEHWTKAAAAKFSRIAELRSKEKQILKEIQQAKRSKNPTTGEAAAVLELIHSTGIRPGSEGDTGAEKQAYGATTLQGRHVVKDGNSIHLKFTGKKGVDLDIPVEDSAVAADLLKRKSKAGETGKLYGANEGDVLTLAHSLDGGGFKTKDFRTLLGTKTALKEVATREKPKTEKEYKKAVKEVAEIVSKKLGNTPTVALQSYIDPTVFSKWRL